MLNKITILVVGGDARHIEVINKLSSQKAKLFVIGFDQLSFDNTTVNKINTDEIPYQQLDAILLPVSGSSLEGKIKLTYTNSPGVYITKEIMSQTPNDCILYTGVTNSYLNKLAKDSKRKLVSLFDRDDVAILNSIATAEGAINLAIEETDHTIHGANVLVLGFGRIGVTVARLFNSIGAKTHVAVRDPAQIARIIEMGCTPIKITDLEKNSAKINIFVNTIPHLVINKEIISAMKPDALIIDLASAPGGTDFEHAQKKGITAIHALGLPGKTAPKSAGEILSHTLTKLIVNSNRLC